MFTNVDKSLLYVKLQSRRFEKPLIDTKYFFQYCTRTLYGSKGTNF